MSLIPRIDLWTPRPYETFIRSRDLDVPSRDHVSGEVEALQSLDYDNLGQGFDSYFFAYTKRACLGRQESSFSDSQTVGCGLELVSVERRNQIQLINTLLDLIAKENAVLSG